MPGAPQGFDTEVRQLVRRHVVPDVAVLRGLDQQAPDQLVDLPLRSPELIGSMHELRDPRALVAARVAREERVGLEHRLESLPRIASLVSDLRKTDPPPCA